MNNRSKSPTLTRRQWLGGVAGVGASACFASSWVARSFAATPEEHRFVALYFSGGWDVLLGPDARDPARSYAGIHLGTDLLDPLYRDPLPVSVGGREALWGAPMSALVPHADVAAVFRGVNMNTVSHGVGQSYVNTFLAPSGPVARGASLGTVMSTAGAIGPELLLPNVSISVPTYGGAYGREHKGIRLDRPTDMSLVLGAHPGDFPADVAQALARAELASTACGNAATQNTASELGLGRERIRRLQAEGVSAQFAFAADRTDMAALRTRYGLSVGDAARDVPAVRAATAAQLLKTGLARAVTVRLVTALDTHSNWGPLQPVRLEEGFRAMAALLADLREDDPGLTRTTVVAFSEFSRTPRINSGKGRDHWFANSFLVFGGKLRPGTYGASGTEDLGLLEVDLETGSPLEGGTILRPEHIGATVVASAGIDPAPFRTEPIAGWMR